MSQAEEKKEGGFKVVDHRRFDDSGNERLEACSAQQPRDPGNVQHEAASKEGALPAEITFGSFILSFAHQALMQMGELPPPPGVELPKDIEGARQTIDIIAMLERKTKGNLDPEEQRLMTEVLHNLRMCFVKKK